MKITKKESLSIVSEKLFFCFQLLFLIPQEIWQVYEANKIYQLDVNLGQITILYFKIIK